MIPQSVAITNNYAFYNCVKLKKVIFHQNSCLKIIGKKAFAKNISLKNFDVPSKVVKIGEKAFLDCPKLQCFEIKDDSMLITFQDDIFNENAKVLVFVPNRLIHS